MINQSGTHSSSQLAPTQSIEDSTIPRGLGPLHIHVVAEATNTQTIIQTADGFLVFVFVILPA